MHGHTHTYIFVYTEMHVLETNIYTYIHTDQQNEAYSEFIWEKHTYIHTYIHTYMQITKMRPTLKIYAQKFVKLGLQGEVARQCVHECMYVYMCVCVSVCMYTCMCACGPAWRGDTSMCAWVYVCMYVYMHMCTSPCKEM